MSGSISVTAITATPSSGSLDVGSTVTFALGVSAAVQVTPASGGQPALTLNNGGLAGYTGMDADGNLLFSYTVGAGESTPDLKVTGLSLNGATIAAQAASTSTLFYGSLTPQGLSYTDNTPYEMGTEFKPTVDGAITSVRFYKSPDETGAHTGHIWSASGQLLATAAYGTETASGWQTAQLATPLPVQAGIDYVVSTNINAYFADTFEGLANSVGSAYIATDGSNGGLYSSPGTFPTQSYGKTNYFEDVEFQFNTPLDVTALATLNGADTQDSVACYLRGTRIAVPGGEVAVEDLAIGDLVATPDGPAPVRWVGRRSYSGRFARGNKAVLPVRVRAGALAPGVPRRDLLVSPKHALLLDGLLIPAEVLVNGASVVQEREVAVVEYVHVELDRHGILLAEGAPAESFVDDNSRGMFHNAREHAALHPGAPRAPAAYCAPRREDGEQVEAVRRRLARRADPAAPSGQEGLGALHGSVDLLADGRLYGWAQHAGRPEVAVCLEVLLDGAVIARTLANRFRADLWQAGLGSGCHAFEAALPEAAQAQAQRRHGTGLRVRRITDGAELPSPSWAVPGSASQHDPGQDCAA